MVSFLFFLLFICLCLVFSLLCVTLLGQFIERYFYGIFTFILALNVFENIFEASLKNTQNKTTVIYLLFATICYFSFASVCKSPNFLALNALLVFTVVKNSAETVSEEFRDKSEIAPWNFVVLRYMLRFGQLCFTIVLLCSQSLQSSKDILIDFPGHTI